MLRRPMAVYILSTGRCGTLTLARMLDLSPDIKCYHEPSPKLIYESKKAYEGSPCSGDVFLACRIELFSQVMDRGLIYGESANRSTFFAPHIDRLFSGRVQFIHVVRDLEGFVESGLKRHWYNGNPWDRGRIIPKAGWSGESQKEKISWLWHETNRWIDRFLSGIENGRKFYLDFSNLADGNLMTISKIFQFLCAEEPPEDQLRHVLRQKANSSERTIVVPVQ